LSPLAVSAAAARQVPFKGTFQGSDTVAPPTITTSATGTGTHLGQFSFAHVITFPALTGSSHWVAANGDSIDTTSVVVSSVLGPVVRTNTENHTITGGTGRFSGAQGSFTVVRTHVLAPSDDGNACHIGLVRGDDHFPRRSRLKRQGLAFDPAIGQATRGRELQGLVRGHWNEREPHDRTR
jgi:hypothetical protein